MSKPFPYTYISCPCTDTSVPGQSALPTTKGGVNTTIGGGENVMGQQGDTEEDDEKTFDPRSPRANYSLYPPEHLLYCEDCHQIKCPRCITEEIVCWYCPNCLFETPSSMVKSEGNRYDCCYASLMQLDINRKAGALAIVLVAQPVQRLWR
jgi:dynactin-4